MMITRKTGQVFSLQLLLVFSFSSFLLSFSNTAFSQPRDPLLQKLDSHYYYPSQLGLKKVAVKIKWLQKDLEASQLSFISHPEVLFFWNAESGERRFQVDPRLKNLTEARRAEIENFFLNYKEAILPRRLSQTLAGFKFNRSDKAYFKTTAEYQALFKSDEIQKYSLDINSEHWRISRIDLKRKSQPYNVISDFKYIQKEGKWLVSETLARFDVDRDSYTEKTSYTYQKNNGLLATCKNQPGF